MEPEPSTFEIRVLRPDEGDSPIDEAVVVIDGREQLAMVGREPPEGGAAVPGEMWIGRRPEDVVGPDSPLLVRAVPHNALVARCDCGFEDCGALLARIARHDDHIVWDRFRCRSGTRTGEAVDGAAFVFDARQYEAAVLGAGRPLSSWEPTSRRAALLLTSLAARWRDDERRLWFAGAGARGDDQVVVQVILGSRGDPDRATVPRGFGLGDEEQAADVAHRLMGHLADGTILDDELAHRRPFGRHPDQS